MFDVDRTVISQYAGPVIRGMIEAFDAAEAPEPLFDLFYQYIWNIDTAQGYGLDVWGRILGVQRVVQLPSTGDVLLVFNQTGSSGGAGDTFGFGVFYDGVGNITNNYALADDQYRILLLAKAATNICSGSIPAINAILLALFPDLLPYCTDGQNMTMTYTFNGTLSPVQLAIVEQTGVLPKPTGVAVSIVQV